MNIEVGDIVESAFCYEEMIVARVEPGKITAIMRSTGAVFEDHPRTFIFIRREKALDDE
jgi:hypothetical protein